jgi:glucose/arabinose dehydrogenase
MSIATRIPTLLIASLGGVFGGAFGSVAAAAGRSLPRSASGHRVSVLATGLTTPTSFAFGAGKVFVGDGGTEDGSHAGGVFVLERGRARRLAGSPATVLGVAWRGDTLYVSALTRLLAWSGWNGSSFAHRRVFYSAPPGFTGFSGLGFGADGRLYAGVYLGNSNDHSPSRAPYAFDVLSFNSLGKDLRIVARGLRQPFQMAFPAGSSSPFMSVLGQDQPPSINPPDYVVRIRPGQNYGFPTCNWLVRSACVGYSRPFRFLRPHASPMGLAIIGHRLYVALFNGLDPSVGAAVAWMPVTGGALKPALTWFPAPIVGLSAHAGSLYVGDVTGRVYGVKP